MKDIVTYLYFLLINKKEFYFKKIYYTYFYKQKIMFLYKENIKNMKYKELIENSFIYFQGFFVSLSILGRRYKFHLDLDSLFFKMDTSKFDFLKMLYCYFLKKTKKSCFFFFLIKIIILFLKMQNSSKFLINIQKKVWLFLII